VHEPPSVSSSMAVCLGEAAPPGVVRFYFYFFSVSEPAFFFWLCGVCWRKSSSSSWPLSGHYSPSSVLDLMSTLSDDCLPESEPSVFGPIDGQFLNFGAMSTDVFFLSNQSSKRRLDGWKREGGVVSGRGKFISQATCISPSERFFHSCCGRSASWFTELAARE
jgi:hypothetical protein